MRSVEANWTLRFGSHLAIDACTSYGDNNVFDYGEFNGDDDYPSSLTINKVLYELDNQLKSNICVYKTRKGRKIILKHGSIKKDIKILNIIKKYDDYHEYVVASKTKRYKDDFVLLMKSYENDLYHMINTYVFEDMLEYHKSIL